MRNGKRVWVCMALCISMLAVNGSGQAQSVLEVPPTPGSGDASQIDRPPQNYHAASDGTPILPMIFPVLGKVFWRDSFAPNGEGGRRRHHGQDLMAPKMRPLVAAFAGRVSFHRAGVGGHNILSLRGDNGCFCTYMHINNDTPGTNDGLGSEDYAYPAGLQSGDQVVAGQLIAFVGNSGNAETVGPHCHFEMWFENRCINPLYSLRAAQHIRVPRVNLALPEIKPNAGEARLDGVVRSVNPATGIVVLDLAATTRPKQGSQSIVAPTRRWLTFKTLDSSRRVADEPTVSASDLTVGAALIALGAEQGKDKATRVYWCKVIAEPKPQPTIVARTDRKNVLPAPPPRPAPPLGPNAPPRPLPQRADEEVFDDFEDGTYANWTLEGDCWGRRPASAALFPGKISGFQGEYFLCTLDPIRGTEATGKATSREFTIRHQHLAFYIGGGNHPGEACLNLVIDGKVVATATGDDSPELIPKHWDISAFQGKTARLEIVDATVSRQRGYIMVDRIVFRRKLPVGKP